MKRVLGVIAFLWLTTACVLAWQVASQHGTLSLPSADKDRNEVAIERDSDPVAGQNLNIVQEYADQVSQMVREERFEEADALATHLRRSRVRYNGGTWKLYTFYYGVGEPWPGRHATEDDWQEHLKRLEKWVAQKPDSITARVALAKAYLSYAWNARGEGYADTVTSSGWRRVEERATKARRILEDAAKLHEKCPEWFHVMLEIERLDGSEESRRQKLFEAAVAFEPEYFYNYRTRAYQLLPKWGGEEGDVAKVLDATTGRLNPDVGNAIYFDVAADLVCTRQLAVGQLSWPRIENGFYALEKRFGPSAWRLNQLAYMANTAEQWIIGDKAMKQLKENWKREIWRTKEYYDATATQLAGFAQMELERRNSIDLAEKELKTPEGAEYARVFQESLTRTAEECAVQISDRTPFTVYFSIGKDGKVSGMTSGTQTTKIFGCLMRTVATSTYAKPAHEPYWVKFEFNAGKPSTAPGQ